MNKLLPGMFVIAAKLVRGQEDLTPEELKNTVLSELEPEYRAFRNRDYNRLKTGAPPRPEELVDIPEGGITVLSVAECALECTKTPNCNAASWYGASPSWADVRNCWLKTLKPACQLPADAERHSDNRAFLIARPRECNGEPSVASPRRASRDAPAPEPDVGDDEADLDDTGFELSADSPEPKREEDTAEQQEDTDETINSPAEVEAVLGNRQMNSDVPTVTEIESGVEPLPCHMTVVLMAALVAHAVLR